MVLTSSDGYQNTYGLHAGGTYPTGMLSCWFWIVKNNRTSTVVITTCIGVLTTTYGDSTDTLLFMKDIDEDIVHF